MTGYRGEEDNNVNMFQGIAQGMAQPDKEIDWKGVHWFEENDNGDEWGTQSWPDEIGEIQNEESEIEMIGNNSEEDREQSKRGIINRITSNNEAVNIALRMEDAIGFFSQQDPLEERRENVHQLGGSIWYNAENFNELRLIIVAAAMENWDEEIENQEQEREIQAK